MDEKIEPLTTTSESYSDCPSNTLKIHRLTYQIILDPLIIIFLVIVQPYFGETYAISFQNIYAGSPRVRKSFSIYVPNM
jgi:hypothetical protein